MEVSWYAAVRLGDDRSEDVCFAYGDTLAACKASARRQLQVPANQSGCFLYGRLTWRALDADESSAVCEMLDAEWIW